MTIVILWIIFAVVVGAIGSGRKIGFLGAFVLSLLLSPLIGLIIALVSEKKPVEVVHVHNQQQQSDFNLDDYRVNTGGSQVDELSKLANLRDRGAITESEFQAQKKKILNA